MDFALNFIMITLYKCVYSLVAMQFIMHSCNNKCIRYTLVVSIENYKKLKKPRVVSIRSKIRYIIGRYNIIVLLFSICNILATSLALFMAECMVVTLYK